RLGMHLAVSWRYGDTAHPFAAEAGTSLATESELRALLEIARRGEIRPLRAQLEDLRSRHPADVRLGELEALARDYQMEQIRSKLSLLLPASIPS
ncbi:MAG TPA: hypothetical protein VEQ65_12815, partial [Opitutus sp.]|nr:hypothetical protein [Opitutus sp.]